MANKVQTRILIMSDTHGADFSPENRPYQRADVALHCGDLSDGSKLVEFRSTLNMLHSIDAPLKLVNAGNHDFTMDIAACESKVAEAIPPLEPEFVAREYGILGQARQLFDDARHGGIVFPDEGTYRFPLENGAILTIYASPYTPSLGGWGFQYHPNRGRHFDINDGTDIVITHGPPKGSWTIPTVANEQVAVIFSPPSLALGPEFTASAISTWDWVRSWLPGNTAAAAATMVPTSRQTISRPSTMRTRR